MMERARLALEMYPENPGRAMQVLRGLFSEDPSGFVRTSAPLLSERDTPGSQPLIELLAQSVGVVELLCDPDFLDKQPSIDLAQRISAIDPGLDSKLVRLLPDRGVNHSDPANTLGAERILELLDAISVSNRVVPMVAHLLRQPNARLRAKASLLIARWTRNVRTAEDRLDESDSRMRANAVEALWGDKTSRAASRATAAWTMGQTGDPQFLPVLEKLTHDLYAPVRKSAARGMELIGKRAEEAQAAADSSI